MSADFTPPLKPYSDINKFKFWCQKVLPIVYDDSLSYYEVLNKVVNYLNEVIENMDNVEDNVKSVYDAFVELQNYVNEYFDSQDWQSMVNNKIDELVIEGYFEEIIEPLVTEDFNRIIEEFNEFKEEVNDDIDDFKEEVNGNIQTQNGNIAVLVTRMDTFASLPDGSTAGDAELLDIRVGANGLTYPSAGDAVRTQVDDLKNALSEITNTDEISFTAGKYIELNGNSITMSGGIPQFSGDSTFSCGMMQCSAGDVFTVSGTGGLSARLWAFVDISGTVLSKANANITETHKILTAPTNSAWIIVQTNDGSMSYKGMSVDEKIKELSDNVNYEIDVLDSDIVDINNRFIISINKFDKTTAVQHKRFTTDGDIVNESSCYYSYIPVKMGVYSTIVCQNIYGDNCLKLNAFRSDMTRVGLITASYLGDTRTGNAVPITFTITNPDIKYIGWVEAIANIDTAMFVEGATYPSEYISYSANYTMPNLAVYKSQIVDLNDDLYGKVLVCDGDSICAASNILAGDYNGYGWCGRIGQLHDMDWHNVAIGGATIATGTSATHYLSTYIDTIHTLYPNIDYLLLEGGTNDADSDVPAGDIAIGDYNIQDSESRYDTSTFYGALNMLFYKATKYYPRSKIGFIIAQKMGDVGGGYSSSDNKRRQYFDMCIEVCIKWGIPYIDLWNEGVLVPRANVFYNRNMTSEQNWANGYAYSDGQHLTNVGYDIITPKIDAWMKTL